MLPYQVSGPMFYILSYISTHMQLHRRLNRLLLSLSKKQTLSLVDKIGHDQDVLRWRDDICSRKLRMQVTKSQPEKDKSDNSQPSNPANFGECH